MSMPVFRVFAVGAYVRLPPGTTHGIFGNLNLTVSHTFFRTKDARGAVLDKTDEFKLQLMQDYILRTAAYTARCGVVGSRIRESCLGTREFIVREFFCYFVDADLELFI